ncbi:hypothetical protein RTCIAT899_PC02635 (plasmid) [Rhizobium tropici CIAT 899]|nr:hypothetical protein RTCIAT899_PC02635 [Rhizobium tropici CIAT 899]
MTLCILSRVAPAPFTGIVRFRHGAVPIFSDIGSCAEQPTCGNVPKTPEFVDRIRKRCGSRDRSRRREPWGAADVGMRTRRSQRKNDNASVRQRQIQCIDRVYYPDRGGGMCAGNRRHSLLSRRTSKAGPDVPACSRSNSMKAETSFKATPRLGPEAVY